jgi:hypothetical protein
MVDRKLKRRLRSLLYMLKREYPGTIIIYKKLSSDTDVRTGKATNTVAFVRIRRAVVMPVRLQRTKDQSISLISSNKEFVTGGTYDVGTRQFLVDRRDAKNLPDLTSDDWIIYDNKKYQIKVVEVYGPNIGWIISAREIVGDDPEREFPVAASNLIDLSQGGDADVS